MKFKITEFKDIIALLIVTFYLTIFTDVIHNLPAWGRMGVGAAVGMISAWLAFRAFLRDLPRMRIGVNEQGEKYYYMISEEELKKGAH